MRRSPTRPLILGRRKFSSLVNMDMECDPSDQSLTNIQWLSEIDLRAFETDSAKQTSNKENKNPNSQAQNTQMDAEAGQQPMSKRPPYSYSVMIQCAINSHKTRKLTLKQIYTWIEENFPYYRETKKRWKNCIRHNLSLHDLFIRAMTPDGKNNLWTIRPEANRYLTIDQVNKQQKRMLPDTRKTPTGSERKMKPLLPRTESYLVPIQLPVASSVYLLSPSPQFPAACSQQKRNTAKRVRIAPKDMRDTELEEYKQEQHTPDREFYAPVKSTSHLASSMPSTSTPLKVTPDGKWSQNLLDFSPIRTPGGPAVTLEHDYTPFSIDSTAFEDWPLFSSPRELFRSAPSRVTGPTDSPSECLGGSCSRELLQAGGTTPTNPSITEDLVLDTMDDSLSKILMDCSLTGLDGEDLNMADITWSDVFTILGRQGMVTQ